MTDPKEPSAEERDTLAVPHVLKSLREGQRESSGPSPMSR